MPAALPFIALGISAAGTGYQIHSAEEAKDKAKEQQAAQEKQQRIQQRINEATARRQARVRRAQIQAVAGAGGFGGSVIESSLRGITSGETAQSKLLKEQGELQREQFSITASQTADAARVSIAQAVGSFTSDVLESDIIK